MRLGQLHARQAPWLLSYPSSPRLWFLEGGFGSFKQSLPLPFSSAAVSSATMRNIFKRNQEPVVAPAATAASTTVPMAPSDNSTESAGAGESKEDMFAKLKDKFFNEINKIPREHLGEGERAGSWGALWGHVGWGRGDLCAPISQRKCYLSFGKLARDDIKRSWKMMP